MPNDFVPFPSSSSARYDPSCPVIPVISARLAIVSPGTSLERNLRIVPRGSGVFRRAGLHVRAEPRAEDRSCGDGLYCQRSAAAMRFEHSIASHRSR